jgi:molybdate transport system substrate-binding protein
VQLRIAALVCAILLSTAIARAADVVVAAAADLNFAMKEIVQEFEKKTGHKVRLTLGSSGNFYAQILNGAPFDLYFSADIFYPKKLEAAGLVETNSLFTYAIGQIALWVPRGSPIDLEKLGMKALDHSSVVKIALANPKHAPYGKSALAAIESSGLASRIRGKLVYGENVSQAAQFVQSGTAEIGVVALALALSEPMQETGRYWRVPPETYPRMEQAAVIIKQTGKERATDAVHAFYDWVRGTSSRRVLERYGFLIPGQNAAEPRP